MSLLPRILYPVVFALPMLVGAALLFFIQPIAGRALLPILGGSAAVWSACLVFFQATVLAGYLAAHLLHRFRGATWQPVVHALLLFLAGGFVLLGLVGGASLAPAHLPAESVAESPFLTTLTALGVALGLPVLLLAATGPLVQRWFAHTRHPFATDPYFLSVAGSLGGLAALFAYVVGVEPFVPLGMQVTAWAIGFAALAAEVLLCAALVWFGPRSAELEPPPPVVAEGVAVPAVRLVGRGEPTWLRRGLWLACAGLPVALLMALTAHLTLDIAPDPLFWIAPLALYLLSYLQAFGRFSPFAYGGTVGRLLLHLIYTALLVVLGVVLLLAAFSLPESARALLIFGMAAAAGALVLMPTSWLQVAQPLAALALLYYATESRSPTPLGILVQMIAFYLTARTCHTVLANDRPAAPFVTSYFAWIGLGGLLGGLFQATVAPVIFTTGFVEYPLAVALACACRPAWLRNGLTDWLASVVLEAASPALRQGQRRHRTALAVVFDVLLGAVVAGLAITTAVLLRMEIWGNNQPFDVWLAQALGGGNPWRWMEWMRILAFLLTAGGCLFLIARPGRYALSLVGVVLAFAMLAQPQNSSDRLVLRERTPYGICRVTDVKMAQPQRPQFQPGEPRPIEHTERQFMHSTTMHGIQVVDPPDRRRLATTYYHRRGPVGAVMRRYDWFPGPDNTYAADARTAASLVALAGQPLGSCTLPVGQLAEVWTEPPYALAGAGIGTQASYARPFQHVDVYELDAQVLRFADGPPGERLFDYFADARDRGAHVRTFTGDARIQLRRHAPEGYYRAIFLDAFSSDAVPTHLLTKEAISMYMDKLAPDGVLCIHTSNRHVDLPPAIGRVADNLGLAALTAKDMPNSPPMNQQDEDRLHFSSEWVLLARTPDPLRAIKEADRAAQQRGGRSSIEWHTREVNRSAPLWTDEHASLLPAMRDRVFFVSWPLLLGLLLGVAVMLALIELLAATVLPEPAPPPAASPAPPPLPPE